MILILFFDLFLKFIGDFNKKVMLFSPTIKFEKCGSPSNQSKLWRILSELTSYLLKDKIMSNKNGTHINRLI